MCIYLSISLSLSIYIYIYIHTHTHNSLILSPRADRAPPSTRARAPTMKCLSIYLSIYLSLYI